MIISAEATIRHLTFWRNGFQVEDGELMRYDDPDHARTLAEINAGYGHLTFSITHHLTSSYLSLAPPSVLGVHAGQRVELRVAKRTQDDYVPPKGARNFGGSGQRLGGVVPSDNTNGGSVLMPGSFPTGNSSTPRASSEAARSLSATKFEVDQSQPTTSIQIRLADGTR
jgi:hypothetical protein